jgi:adenylate kinase family enzyme
VGSSGAGKSTLARALAKRLEVPYVELDALMHQPGWQLRPDDQFMDEVEKATSQPGWVVDGNYRRFVIEGPVWQRADAVVWLDLPRRTVMRQVIARTVRRAVTREALWNGNREPISNFVSLDPDDNIILWSWVKYDEFVKRYLDALADPRWSEISFVRLRSHAEARLWLDSIVPSAASYVAGVCSGSSQGSASAIGRMSVAACSLLIRLLATSPSAAAKAALSALCPISPCSAFHDTSASPDSVSPKRELLT